MTNYRYKVKIGDETISGIIYNVVNNIETAIINELNLDTKEILEFTYEEAEKCDGCLNDYSNQLGHMGHPDGCLHSKEDCYICQ